MTDQELNDLFNRFNCRLNELIAPKSKNTQIFSKIAYFALMEKVKESKAKVKGKMPEDYQRLRKYDVLCVGESEKLIVPVKSDNLIKYYVYTDEIFPIIHATHITLGHAGRSRMEKELKSKYRNITREMIKVYLHLCDICQKKQNITKECYKVKQINNSRCQVDLVDMQLKADEEYKYILVYRDCRTRFLQLRPLKTKSVDEVANVLLDIFTIFGAPDILQSDNGREYANDIIVELSKVWNELKMVHGKSSSSVEANRDIEDILESWLIANNTDKWSEGLKFVQLTKNREQNIDLNCSAYEAMFGSKLKVGLRSFLPPEAVNDVHTEEDLELFQKWM